MELTLKTAIENEQGTTTDQKSEQIQILTKNAQEINKSDLEKIMKGELKGVSYNMDDMHSLKSLAVFRIENELPMYPFSGFKLGKGWVKY